MIWSGRRRHSVLPIGDCLMAVRDFQDSQHTLWRVWETRSNGPGAPGETSWLTFESGGQRRRLRPVPLAWERAPETKLEQMCRIAEPVLAGPQRSVADRISEAIGWHEATEAGDVRLHRHDAFSVHAISARSSPLDTPHGASEPSALNHISLLA